MTVIVTDAKYRASLAAVRAFAKCGADIVLTQTAGDVDGEVFTFSSKYASRTVLFDCSVDDEAYLDKLYALALEYERPVLFPVGAKTTAIACANSEKLKEVCDFVLPTPEALDFANDKNRVRLAAESFGIKVPYTYEPGVLVEDFPVVVKPECGEKYGLKAAERYIIVNDVYEYADACDAMSEYGELVIQKYVTGEGIGVSLLMNSDGRAVSAICHRRVREYPISGGPSACCESFYNEELVKIAEKLLAHISYTGMAMVEFKGDCVLEINPRVWGSFPLTFVADSTFCKDYLKLSRGEDVCHELNNYKVGKRMNFLLSDLAACASLLKHGRIKEAASGICDIVFRRAKDGIYDNGDTKPFWRYLRGKIL